MPQASAAASALDELAEAGMTAFSSVMLAAQKGFMTTDGGQPPRAAITDSDRRASEVGRTQATRSRSISDASYGSDRYETVPSSDGSGRYSGSGGSSSEKAPSTLYFGGYSTGVRMPHHVDDSGVGGSSIPRRHEVAQPRDGLAPFGRDSASGHSTGGSGVHRNSSGGSASGGSASGGSASGGIASGGYSGGPTAGLRPVDRLPAPPSSRSSDASVVDLGGLGSIDGSGVGGDLSQRYADALPTSPPRPNGAGGVDGVGGGVGGGGVPVPYAAINATVSRRTEVILLALQEERQARAAAEAALVKLRQEADDHAAALESEVRCRTPDICVTCVL